VIGFFGSTIHHTDVGGYGIGAGARDVFEEGLWIPICKLLKAGERNHDVWRFILSNVRQPDHMAGDLHAQVASGEVGSQRLQKLCDAHASTTSRISPTRSSCARRRPPAAHPGTPGRHLRSHHRAGPRRRFGDHHRRAITIDPRQARSSSTTPAPRGRAPSASTW
jgi:hypothetical protein